MVGEHHQLLAVELARLAQNLAEYLIADGFGCLDEAASLTGWTRLAQHMFQAFARSLARRLDPSGETDEMLVLT